MDESASSKNCLGERSSLAHRQAEKRVQKVNTPLAYQGGEQKMVAVPNGGSLSKILG
jgi:hypothetical protein